MLSRRMFAQGALASVLSQPAAGAAASVNPMTITAFIDSVGVNTHLSSPEYGARFDLVRRLLARSGIRHLRDELRPHNKIAHWQTLYSELGVRGHMLVSPTTNSVEQLTNYVAALGIEKLSAIEGQNEGDGDWFRSQIKGDWAKVVVDYQRAVHEALRAKYEADALPIVSPTVLDYKPEDMLEIGSAADYCDIVAIHSYVQKAQEPETNDRLAGLAWYVKSMVDPFKPGAPVMATETGYHNLTKPAGSGLSEKAAATYVPRLLLNNYVSGIKRTFLYQLLDGGADAGDPEHHYGLVRHDDTPKPAFEALSLLLGSFKSVEAAGASQRHPGQVALTPNPQGARLAQFANSNGRTLLAVWRPVKCWDAWRGIDITVDQRPVGVRTNNPVRATWLDIGGGGSWSEPTPAVTTFEVPVGANVVLIAFNDAT